MAHAYQSPPLSYEDQLKQLERRGLLIKRRRQALELLATVGYTRLSGFWDPLLLPESKQFGPNASFEDVYDRYQADSRLRQLTLYAVNHVEIALRAGLTYHISHDVGTGLWIGDFEVLTDPNWQSGFVQRALKGLAGSRDPWAKEYRRLHANVTPIPPAWIALQFANFGDLAKIRKRLTSTRTKAAVCARYGVIPDVLISWIGSLHQLRNACAHHARIWNRNLHSAPVWPKSLARRKDDWVSSWEPDPAIAQSPFTQHRSLGDAEKQGLTFYAAACVMKYLVDRINPTNTFRKRLEACLAPHAAAGQPVEVEAGFPSGWREEPLWQNTNGFESAP